MAKKKSNKSAVKSTTSDNPTPTPPVAESSASPSTGSSSSAVGAVATATASSDITQITTKEQLAQLAAQASMNMQRKDPVPIGASGKRTKRAPLLSSDDKLLPNVSTALLEIFARFDNDNDGALNLEELEAFAISTNGEKVLC